MKMRTWFWRAAAAALVAAAASQPAASQPWEPTRTVEFIVPAGAEGGADQMARATQGIIPNRGWMKQSTVGMNKAGVAGAEGLVYQKDAKGDPHKGLTYLS